VLSALVVVAAANIAVRLVSDDPVVAGTRAAGLVWAERVFTSKREFASYLRSRGASYDAWAARHPGAAPWEPKPSPRRRAAAPPTRPAPDGDVLALLASIPPAIAVASLLLLLMRRRRGRSAAVAPPPRDEGDRKQALERRRAVAWTTSALATFARPVVALFGRAAFRLVLGTSSRFAALRQPSRQGNVTSILVTTYSLGAVSAAGVGLLVAYLSGH
jgi:hypothetical protein